MRHCATSLKFEVSIADGVIGISDWLNPSGGLGSVVGIATGYRLDGPWIESRWGGRDFPHLSRPAAGPTQPPVP